MTTEKFERLLASQRKALEQDAGFGAMCRSQCPDFAPEEFFAPGGMTIGRLAKRCGLPVSSLRYYVKLGLVEPILVAGRWRFLPVNLWELASLLQWQRFGASLEQVLARKRRIAERWPGTVVLDVLGPLWLSGFEGRSGLVWFCRHPRDGGVMEELRVGLADGQSHGDEQDAALFSFMVEDLERARQRLANRLEQLSQVQGLLESRLKVLVS